MRRIRLDNAGSVAPLIVVVAIIVLVGILWGVLDIVVNAVSVSETSTDDLVLKAWVFSVIVVLLVVTGWLFMVAQKNKTGGW